VALRNTSTRKARFWCSEIRLRSVYNLQTLDARSKKWTEELFRKPAPTDFRQFYNFTFDYLKEDKKILLTEEALMVWKMLFTTRWPLLDKWLAFVTVRAVVATVC
jgi:hypothetical protein